MTKQTISWIKVILVCTFDNYLGVHLNILTSDFIAATKSSNKSVQADVEFVFSVYVTSQNKYEVTRLCWAHTDTVFCWKSQLRTCSFIV